MAFQAGTSGNPNGRPKGSRNKITQELQEKISAFLSENIDSIQKEYDQLSSNDKLKFITNILPYVMPKIKEEEEPPVRVLQKSETYNLINSLGWAKYKKSHPDANIDEEYDVPIEIPGKYAVSH